MPLPRPGRLARRRSVTATMRSTWTSTSRWRKARTPVWTHTHAPTPSAASPPLPSPALARPSPDAPHTAPARDPTCPQAVRELLEQHSLTPAAFRFPVKLTDEAEAIANAAGGGGTGEDEFERGLAQFAAEVEVCAAAGFHRSAMHVLPWRSVGAAACATVRARVASRRPPLRIRQAGSPTLHTPYLLVSSVERAVPTFACAPHFPLPLAPARLPRYSLEGLSFGEHFRLAARRLEALAPLLRTHDCALGLEFLGSYGNRRANRGAGSWARGGPGWRAGGRHGVDSCYESLDRLPARALPAPHRHAHPLTHALLHPVLTTWRTHRSP